MNEVTKLYKNAGIKKDWNSTPYGGIEEYYPPFTAEKQIRIIEWLGNSKAFFDANETISSLITNHKDKKQ